MHLLIAPFLYWLWLALGSLARPNQSKPSMKNSIILKVTAHSHSPTIIEDLLRDVFQQMFPLANYDPTRSCITGTSITYQYKNSEYIYIDHPASECRLNVDSQFLAVIKPKESIHFQIHKDNAPNLVLKEVQDAIVYRIQNSADFDDINFFCFDNLNYNLECSIDYYEIGQVMFREQCLKITLEKNFQIGSECGFGTSNSNDDESCLKSYEHINIPLNGTFYCASGRSATCKRSTAESKNAHLRNILGSY